MKTNYSTDVPGYDDFYHVLGVASTVAFGTMKRAYYARAKECHPDANPDVLGAEAQFRILVNAFDVLSDPEKRRQYDVFLRGVRNASSQEGTSSAFTYSPARRSSVMDSVADDILEELVVSNNLPKGATMQTLMRDLEHTETFMAFREAKNLFFLGHYAQALFILNRLCTTCGGLNVLHHYYLGRCGEMLRRWRVADKHYRTCISIGKRRIPMQRLNGIRCRLHDLRKGHGGLLGSLKNMITGDPPRPMISSEDEMIDDATRAIGRLLSSQQDEKTRIGSDRQLK